MGRQISELIFEIREGLFSLIREYFDPSLIREQSRATTLY